MDGGDLYDEFGNYIGPELDSDESEDEDGRGDGDAGSEEGVSCLWQSRDCQLVYKCYYSLGGGGWSLFL